MIKNENKHLINALKEYLAKDRIMMHMPGHKGGKLFSGNFKENLVRYDLTEIPGLDQLHNPKDVIAKSLKACAEAFGAQESFYLVNGSTSGIHAMLASALNSGDRLLVARNCHISVIHGLILFGIEPVFVMPQYDEEWNIALPAGITAWKRALDRNPDVRGALVTSPDYYGFCAPLKELSDLLHDRGKLLLVDEAHGAHFNFSGRLPEPCLKQGADMCVQSLHKTMPALTQAALLHIGSSRIHTGAVKKAVSMLTTTSPSYILMASMEYAIDFAKREGEKHYNRLTSLLNDMKRDLLKMEKLRLVPDQFLHFQRDPTRIVVDASNADISGFELSRRLDNDYGIIAEMADEYHTVFIVTPADSEREINAMKSALLLIDRSVKRRSEGKECVQLEKSELQCKIPGLSDVLHSTAQIPLERAAGYVCAEVVTPYPPGIPVLLPGEIITNADIKHICRMLAIGSEIHGIDGDEKMIRVIDRDAGKK